MTQTRSGRENSMLPATGRRPPNGFSLLEALIAIVLVSIAALAVAGEISITMASSHMGTEQSRATALAVQKMEELKPLPADEVVSESKKSVNALGEEGPGPYVRWVDVQTGGAGGGTKIVRVFVEYNTGRFGRRTVELYTIIYAGD